MKIRSRMFLFAVGLGLILSACGGTAASTTAPRRLAETGSAPGTSAPLTTTTGATTSSSPATTGHTTTSVAATTTSSTLQAATTPATTTSVTVAATSPPTTVEAPPAAEPPLDLVVVGRGGWGARPPDTDKLVPHTVNRLTVHHAGDQTSTTGPPRFRGWQAFHMDERGWADISYHFIVGVDGMVYEARDVAYRTETGTNYDTTGHFQVVVEGNFESDHPTDAQLDSLARVLAWASDRFGVEPSTIAGHQEHAQTLCPGSHLQDYIASGQLLEAVESLLAAGGVNLSS